MLYFVAAFSVILLVILVMSGHWQYALFSMVLFAVISVPFVAQARKMPAGRRLKTVFGAVAILAIFVVVVFLAAFILNWVYWKLAHI